MLKLKRYLKPYIAMLLAAVVLLFGQAMLELTLPNYMSDIVNVGLQQGGKTIGTGQDAVAYAVLLPLQGCFLAGIGAGYGQTQFPVGAQRCQLAGEPTAAYIAGTCQPAGSRRLRQYSVYKPEDVHKG